MLPMNCGRDGNPTYHIFILSGASVLFLTQRIVWEILTQKVIVEHSLNTLKDQRHLECTTQEP